MSRAAPRRRGGRQTEAPGCRDHGRARCPKEMPGGCNPQNEPKRRRPQAKTPMNTDPIALRRRAAPAYDAEGNDFIETHVGPLLFRFPLEAAIAEGILCEFDYYPLYYFPSDDDRQRIQGIFARASVREATGDPMSDEELWIELSRVHKTSKAKLPAFDAFVRRHPELLNRCIVFVETREYGEQVLEIIHRYRHDFHTYYASEDHETLRRFATGQVACLLTCHRLSEGIDIRGLESVVLFSSARARLETIQRIGRSLRVDPSNPSKRACSRLCPPGRRLGRQVERRRRQTSMVGSSRDDATRA